MNFIKLLLSSIRFDLAVYKANLMHKANGRRYYVIPSIQRGKLLVLCNQDIKMLKKKHIIKKNYSHLDIMEGCLYFTDLSGKTNGRMEKERVSTNKKKWNNYIKKLLNNR